MKHAIHPAADLFPMMGNAELAALAADIVASGLRESVKLAEDGSVLDGRNRLAACRLAKVEPVFETVLVDDPVAYVVSANVMRRNLSKQQAAIAAAESWAIYGGPPTRGGDRSKDDSSSLLTREKLAAMWGVGKDFLTWATALVYEWPEAAAKVKEGKADLAGSYDVLQAARRRSEDAEKEIEREIKAAAKRREALAALAVPDPDLLPPPTRAFLDAAVDPIKTMNTALPPLPPEDDPETAGALKQWHAAIRESRKATDAFKLLPPFPLASQDASILAVVAVEAAKRLCDAAAHLTKDLPAQEAATPTPTRARGDLT